MYIWTYYVMWTCPRSETYRLHHRVLQEVTRLLPAAKLRDLQVSSSVGLAFYLCANRAQEALALTSVD